MKRFPILILLILIFCTCNQIFAQGADAVSPSGQLKITATLENGKISYRVSDGRTVVLRPSAMGIQCSGTDFSEGLKWQGTATTKITDSYRMLVGKQLSSTATANETIIRLQNKMGTAFQIHLRAYNDGVAFRYHFPVVNNQIVVEKELTAFALPAPGKIWVQPYGLPADWAPAYESIYSNGSPTGEAAPDSSGYGFPALFEVDGRWMLITEAGLDASYFGSHLAQDCSNNMYQITVPMATEGYGIHPATATNNKPFSTPWRVVLTSKNVDRIVQSNLVHHLAKPNQVSNTSWIKPGASSWSWWSDHRSSTQFEKLKKFIDLSAYMKWPYSLVDANWNIMQDGDIKSLLNYARTKNVGLILWYNSAGPHSTITEQPRDRMHDAAKRKAEFAKLKSWGVKGVKVDFFNSDKQALIKLYLDILKDAADAQLMVDFHGCTLPRGWARTFPNLMTMEAVKGAEQYSFDTAFTKHAATLNIIYAFTRNVVGSMDYTPVTFSNYSPQFIRTTTAAHELAQAVIFESGLQHFADSDSSYRAQSKAVQEFLSTVPVAWDETRLLEGYPGDYVVLARRRGNDWYVGGFNGEQKTRTVIVHPDFLQGAYNTTVYKDGGTQQEIVVDNPTSGQPVYIDMPLRGGFVVRYRKTF